MVFALALLALFPQVSLARERLPEDPEIIKGKLANGLTYYIRHNEDPAGCADFYIAHNVGALQEEDSQNGLAHFLEHMAFNGTVHYPGKTVLEFLAKEGVRFGYNVNAYTTRTETVYNLSSIPLVRDSFVDSVLMVLHDWSCGILCEEDALDAERGVISEEWRRKDNARMRMMSRQNDLIYKGAKHTQRSVLGTLEVINGFAREDILGFYHKWYRPDLQAIIIVGDFDPEEMERKVRRLFSDIPAAESPAGKEPCPVPALDGPLFENMTDPDIGYRTLKVIHKTPYPEREERAYVDFLKDFYCRQVASAAVSARFRTAAEKPGSHVRSSVLVQMEAGTDFYVSMFTLTPEKDGYLEDLLMFYELEIKRLSEYGISEDEFRNAKFNVYRKRRLGRQDTGTRSKEIVDACLDDFLRGIPCTGPEYRRMLEKRVLDSIGYEDVLPYIGMMFMDSEKIYSYSINDSISGVLPSPERMRELVRLAGETAVERDFPESSSVSLDVSSHPGKVIGIHKVKGTGMEKWTLDNGAVLYWQPSGPGTDGTVLSLKAYFSTGYGAFPQDSTGIYRAAARFIDRYAGFRGMDRAGLEEMPECYGAGVSLSSDPVSPSVSMRADSGSIGKGFRMFHLQMTEPFFSSGRTLEKYVRDNVSYRRTPLSDHDRFSRAVRQAEYGGHPWKEDLDSNCFTALTPDLLSRAFGRLFGDPGRMTVYVTGAPDRDTLLALVEKYVASVRGACVVKPSRVSAPGPVYRGKVVVDSLYTVRTVPKSTVDCRFRSHIRLSTENIAALDVLDYIMSGRYMDRIREERGGTYHVAVETSALPSDRGSVSMSVSFETRPEITDLLISDVMEIMDDMCRRGPDDVELSNARKYLLKRHAEQLERKEGRLSVRCGEMADYIMYGYDAASGYAEALAKVTARDVRSMASRLGRGHVLLAVCRENTSLQ